MQSAEIELKFSLADASDFESTLTASGFRLQTPRTFEHNTLYDTRDRALRARHEVLRIRQYGDVCTLTHKRQPAGADDSLYKTRIETETTVTDGAALVEIFHQLGYDAVFVYEKYRSEWVYPLEGETAHLVVDETPIGTWAELEGPTHWIDAMLLALHINRKNCSTDSYGKLFSTWKQASGSRAENLTFQEISPELLHA